VQLPYERTDGRGRIALTPEGAAHRFGHAETITIPRSWRIIATMNVFDKSLLFEMSFALMRRFTFIEVPSPSIDDFLDLITEQTQGDAEARDLAASFLPLRSVKDLGPAVFMDLARYVRERRDISQDGDGQLAFEAFYGYLLPQFEGIDEEAGQELYKLVRKIVGPANRDRLRSTLRAVLGLELASPGGAQESEIVDEFPEPAEIQADELEED
jgi:MoxR-like ATPase